MDMLTQMNDTLATFHTAALDVPAALAVPAEAVPAEEEIDAVTALAATIPKKYRAVNYDNADKTYATELLAVFLNEDKDVQAKFNEFTENLMAEKEINRYGLLGAIDDYKAKSPTYFDFPLSTSFENLAFNCRPYQACVIC